MLIFLLPSLNSVSINLLLDAVPISLLIMLQDTLDLLVDEVKHVIVIHFCSFSNYSP